MATRMPVGTRARPPAALTRAPVRATRSAPASPTRAYAGSGRSGSRRTTETSSTIDKVPFGPVLAWMDLEMTGLDPELNVIVEIATLITDDELNVVAEGPDLVVKASDAELSVMDEVVRAMHTKSGLLPAIEGSTTSLADAG